jgi:hypothetical protein
MNFQEKTGKVDITINMKSYTSDTIWGAIFVVIIGLVIYSWIFIGTKNNTIKVIDNCQYIQQYNGHGWNLTHKGNCTNAIHYKK